MGPLTRRSLSLARLIKSRQTSKDGKARSFWARLFENNLRTLLKIRNVTAGECDADFMHLGRGDWGTRGIIVFFTLSDVTHCAETLKCDSGD